MHAPRWHRAALLLGAVVAGAGALVQLALIVRLFAGRVGYAGDIDWLESSVLYQAWRVAHGLPTYGPLRDGYIALFHPPGYPLLLGLLGKLVGVDHATGRALSIAFFAGASALVVRALRRRLPGRPEGALLGALAVACAAAGVPVFEGFYDVVRDDMMAVFLALLAAVLVDGERRPGRARVTLVSLLIAAVVFTRQPTVFLSIWTVVFAFARHRPSGLRLALGGIAASGLGLVAALITSKGWYWILTFTLLADHKIEAARALQGLGAMVSFAPFVVLLPFVMAWLRARRRLSASTVLWVGLLVASLPASLLPYAKIGGFANDFLPTVFLIGPATAMVLADLLLALEHRPDRALIGAVVFAVAGAFPILRAWDVDRLLPTADARRHIGALHASLGGLPGGLVCPRHPFLPLAAGKTTLQWSDMPYFDLLWAAPAEVDLGRYVDQADPRWALVAGTEAPLTQRELAVRFQLEGVLAEVPDTIVGVRSQPRILLRRQDGEEGARVLFDFEGALAGWVQAGDGFARVPPGRRTHGALGQGLLSSSHPTKKDHATGRATSPRFGIDRPRLALRLGGCPAPACRAELRVGERVVRAAGAVFDRSEVLVKVVWDVAELRGHEAELSFVDEDPGARGHLLVDQVVLY